MIDEDYFEAYESFATPRDHPEQLHVGRIAIMFLVLLYIIVGAWITTHKFNGELPDGRWEWAHGTHERITEVIKLEDQHGD